MRDLLVVMVGAKLLSEDKFNRRSAQEMCCKDLG